MKILAIGDLHCGHLLGITPPQYMRRFMLSDLMSEFWDWFTGSLPKDIDIALWNGDLVEGEGHKDTSFHLTTDVNEQCDMAKEVIRMVNAKQNIFTYGTPYHTGHILDYEKIIAGDFGGNIQSKQRCSFNGVRFDVQHKIGKTSTPVGGDIMRKKAIIWNHLYSIIEGQDPADYIIRSHIHEYGIVGNSRTQAITLPAMKIGDANFDRYPRGMEGWYDVGFCVFNCEDKDKHGFDLYRFQHDILGKKEYAEYKIIQE